MDRTEQKLKDAAAKVEAARALATKTSNQQVAIMLVTMEVERAARNLAAAKEDIAHQVQTGCFRAAAAAATEAYMQSDKLDSLLVALAALTSACQ